MNENFEESELDALRRHVRELQAANNEQAQALTRLAAENTRLREQGRASTQEEYDEKAFAILRKKVADYEADARNCFAQDHKGRLMELEALREQLSMAVFGSPTLDSMQQLIVGVRALRQVMVDGIAARSRVLTTEDYPADLLDYDEDRPNPLAVIDEGLEKAGIDRKAECRYQVKGWGDTEDEWCADTGVKGHMCGLADPMHASAHMCRCGSELSHEQAERLQNAVDNTTKSINELKASK